MCQLYSTFMAFIQYLHFRSFHTTIYKIVFTCNNSHTHTHCIYIYKENKEVTAALQVSFEVVESLINVVF